MFSRSRRDPALATVDSNQNLTNLTNRHGFIDAKKRIYVIRKDLTLVANDSLFGRTDASALTLCLDVVLPPPERELAREKRQRPTFLGSRIGIPDPGQVFFPHPRETIALWDKPSGKTFKCPIDVNTPPVLILRVRDVLPMGTIKMKEGKGATPSAKSSTSTFQNESIVSRAVCLGGIINIGTSKLVSNLLNSASEDWDPKRSKTSFFYGT